MRPSLFFRTQETPENRVGVPADNDDAAAVVCFTHVLQQTTQPQSRSAD